MADIAASLVDDLLPEAPYRQWVLTFPWSLRFRLAVDRALFGKPLRVILRTVFAWQRQSKRPHGADARWPRTRTAPRGINAAVHAGVASIEHGSMLDDETIRLMKQQWQRRAWCAAPSADDPRAGYRNSCLTLLQVLEFTATVPTGHEGVGSPLGLRT